MTKEYWFRKRCQNSSDDERMMGIAVMLSRRIKMATSRKKRMKKKIKRMKKKRGKKNPMLRMMMLS